MSCLVEDLFARSSEGQDNDWPSSGPHTSVTGVCMSGSGVPAVSQPEEQAQSATGALKDTMEAESESVVESTDGSMQTSSDGGSTVRGLNKQLELHTGSGVSTDWSGSKAPRSRLRFVKIMHKYFVL